MQKQTYRSDKAIVANSAKNRKKADKKRKAREKKISDSDGSSVEGDNLIRTDMLFESFDESCNDSGLASSLEESMSLEFDEVACSNVMMDDVETNPFKLLDEYIFQMDF